MFKGDLEINTLIAGPLSSGLELNDTRVCNAEL